MTTTTARLVLTATAASALLTGGLGATMQAQAATAAPAGPSSDPGVGSEVPEGCSGLVSSNDELKGTGARMRYFGQVSCRRLADGQDHFAVKLGCPSWNVFDAEGPWTEVGKGASVAHCENWERPDRISVETSHGIPMEPVG